jgi:hypothetical protein
MLYFIHILFVIVNIFEARLESIIILLKDPKAPNYVELNRKEHFWSAAYYASIVALVTGISILYIGFTWKVIPTVASLLISRRIFFEYGLKLFRKGKKIRDIEGDQAIDQLMRSIFGSRGGYKELFLMVILQVILFYIILKN